MANQKEKERPLATIFQTTCLPTFTIDPTEHERPDFRLTDGFTTIGLELTYLIDPAQTGTDVQSHRLETRLHEQRRARLARQPTSILGKIHVYAIPREHRKKVWPGAREHDTFVNDLLDLVEREATGDHQTIIIDPATHPTLAAIHGLQVVPAPKISPHWPWPLWPQERHTGTSQSILISIIEKKKALAATYDRTGLDELWLGIVAGPWEIDLATTFQDHLTAATKGDPTPFDRIVIADPSNPHTTIVSNIEQPTKEKT